MFNTEFSLFLLVNVFFQYIFPILVFLLLLFPRLPHLNFLLIFKFSESLICQLLFVQKIILGLLNHLFVLEFNLLDLFGLFRSFLGSHLLFIQSPLLEILSLDFGLFFFLLEHKFLILKYFLFTHSSLINFLLLFKAFLFIFHVALSLLFFHPGNSDAFSSFKLTFPFFDLFLLSGELLCCFFFKL